VKLKRRPRIINAYVRRSEERHFYEDATTKNTGKKAPI
jgi:hypothetical protein